VSYGTDKPGNCAADRTPKVGLPPAARWRAAPSPRRPGLSGNIARAVTRTARSNRGRMGAIRFRSDPPDRRRRRQ